MEFFDWNALGSLGGAVLAVTALTQITKNVPLIMRIPTQLWSYLLSLATLLLAQLYTGGVNTGGIVLCLFNAALVSLAANGGYDALLRLKEASSRSVDV